MSAQPASRPPRRALGAGRPAPSAGGGSSQLVRNTLFHLTVGLILAVFVALGLADRAALDPAIAARSGAIFFAIAGLVLLGLAGHPFRRFGPANLVTTLRAVIACTLAALVVDIANLEIDRQERLMWGVCGIAIAAVALDGIDGVIARRRQEVSSFGARYDMEVDAFLILVLSVFAFVLDKAGVFVLAIGLMRYGFVVAGRRLPWLEAELPPSQGRKLICAIQGVVLCVVVAPPVGPPVSTMLAAWILLLLVWSFVRDIVWLWRRA